jgi:aryl-alcohol dehydrogenase-like predicted oxidoreductase
VEGQWIAQRRGRERVVSEQPPYSILARGVEREVLPVAQRYGLAVIPWSALAGGWLSGRYHAGLDAPISRRADRLPARFDPTLPANAAKRYRADLAEVRAYGASDSTVRTPHQTDTATFWLGSSLTLYTGILRAALAQSTRPTACGRA